MTPNAPPERPPRALSVPANGLAATLGDFFASSRDERGSPRRTSETPENKEIRL